MTLTNPGGTGTTIAAPWSSNKDCSNRGATGSTWLPLKLPAIAMGLFNRFSTTWLSSHTSFTSRVDASPDPVLNRMHNFRELPSREYDEAFISLGNAEGIGRPLGTADFVDGLERPLGRPIARRAPGRKATPRIEGEQLNLLQ
jgi:hypothetical protein